MIKAESTKLKAESTKLKAYSIILMSMKNKGKFLTFAAPILPTFNEAEYRLSGKI